jgi:hypothetical protein
LHDGGAKQVLNDFESGQTSAQEENALFRGELERECRTYARYLSGQTPRGYIIEKYQDFHQKIGVAAERDRFDRFLVSVSSRGAIGVRLGDSYASFWSRNSALRKKRIVTLALLEAAPPTFEILDRVPRGGRIGAVVRLGVGALQYTLTLLVATALFTPVRWYMTVRNR